MSRKSFESVTSSLPPQKFKFKIKSTLTRLNELSKPKIRIDAEEELVGPASYNPKETYLSTKAKSPSIAIDRSERFIRVKLNRIKERMKSHHENNEASPINYFVSEVNPPKYTFKRTGHNLILVNNPGFPGAGRYSPGVTHSNSAFSFPKASKNFSWKKCKAHLLNRGWLY